MVQDLQRRPSQWRMGVSLFNPFFFVVDNNAWSVNVTRALRVGEIMTDFQNLQQRISEYAPNPPPEEYFEEGYEVLRQCRAEAQAVLVAPYPAEPFPAANNPEEREKMQLQRYARNSEISGHLLIFTQYRVLLDASARRFQAKKIYLRAVAAIRWSNARNTISQSQASQQTKMAQYQQTTNALRSVRTLLRI